MGDFSTVCAMSGISMMNDPVVFFPLARRKHWGSDGYGVGRTHICTNEGPQSLFTVAMLPVFGTIDSYGRLEDIEESENTAAIERVLGIKIEDFFDEIRNGRIMFDTGELFQDEPATRSLYGCFVHRQMYDRFSVESKNESGENEYTLAGGASFDITVETLVRMGFDAVEVPRDNQYDEPQFKLTHADIPEFIAATKPSGFYDFTYKGKPVSACSVKSIVTQIKKLTKHTFSDDVLKYLNNTPANQALLDAARNQARGRITDSLKEEEALKAYNINIKRDRRSGPIAKAVERGNDFLRWVLPSGSIEKFWPEIDAGKLDQDLVDFDTFRGNMYAANRLFMPSWSGYQYGSHHANRDIHREAVKILSSKINPNKG